MTNTRRKDSAVTELHEAMEGKIFPTRESAQAYADVFIQARNNRALDDFCGLSPDQMSQFLYAPFDSPGLIRMRDRIALSACADVPMLSLFLMLVEAIGESGLKPTAKGNLPRAVCQHLAAAYHQRFAFADEHRIGPVSTETDFIELHVVRKLSELAGLVRRYKGRFVVTRKCRQLIQKQDAQGLYPVLFECYVSKFNWAYWDHFPALPIVQQAFLFTLYLLTLHGDQYRPLEFYADVFLKAFPAALAGMPDPQPYEGDAVSRFRNLYEYRCLRRFAVFLGLAALRVEENPDAKFPHRYACSIRRAPLLVEFLAFDLEAGTGA